MSVLYPLLPNINRQFFDNNGLPLAFGSVAFKAAGTGSDKNTYTTAGTPRVANLNPLNLDANGRCVAFLEPGAYDITIYPLPSGGGSPLATLLAVEDVGQTQFAQLGLTLATGATSVTSGYTVLATDQFVTVASTGGSGVVNLPPVVGRGLPIGIKNLGTVALAITPNGADTIDTHNAPFAVAAAADPIFPSVWLVPDGVSAWWVLASHKP